MKKITYKTLKVQNFLSIGNDTITIDFQNGLNLITGLNIDNPERKNAVGKSAIVDAYYYALFGTNIRNINKEFVQNTVTKGKGNIELIFDVQTDTGTSSYKIVRQIKPSKCELFKLGDTEEDISKDSIANTNKYICDLVGSNPIISKSCDILSLSDNIPFMAKLPDQKRKFIEDIFVLEIFGKMLKDLKELIKENNKELTISSTKLDEINNTLNTLITQQLEYEGKIKERELVLEEKRNDIQLKIEETEDNISKIVISDVSVIQIELDKYDKACNKIDGVLAKINDEISSNETLKKLKIENIRSVSSVEGVKCDKCLQDIPHTHVDHLEKLKFQYKEELDGIVATIDELRNKKFDTHSKKVEVQSKVGKLQEKINEIKVTTQKLEGLNNILHQYRESLNNLKLEELPIPAFEENIKKLQERKDIEDENYKNLKQKSEDYEVCKFILGEEGVKSFIIKRLLDMLNSSIQKYITALGMTMKCKFDEYFDEQMTDDRGSKLCYWSFSGGERKTIDLACAWAFKDIKKKISGTSSNVEFLDEILDSAFDERGLDLLIEVIKDRIDRDKLSCYAISHRKETIKHIDGETVNLEKENKITRRV